MISAWGLKGKKMREFRERGPLLSISSYVRENKQVINY